MSNPDQSGCSSAFLCRPWLSRTSEVLRGTVRFLDIPGMNVLRSTRRSGSGALSSDICSGVSERVGKSLVVFTGPLRWRPAGTNNS